MSILKAHLLNHIFENNYFFINYFMKVLYLGCFCEPTTMPLINKRTKGRISVSATTFQRALLHGYDKLEYKPNYIVNVPDIGSFPMRCSSPFFPRSKFEFASMKGAVSYEHRELLQDELYRKLLRRIRAYETGEKAEKKE